MKVYIGTKMIQAKPMNRLAYTEYRGWTLPQDENGDDEGYLVEYLDGGKANDSRHAGYISWSPKAQFEQAYRDTTEATMTFGHAIDALKHGLKVARAGWNGKGMWLGLHKEGGTWVREECGTKLTLCDYIVMKTVDDQLVPWIASQTDMLSEDWMVIP